MSRDGMVTAQSDLFRGEAIALPVLLLALLLIFRDVAAALSGLLAFSDPTFTSVPVGGISTVLVALASTLTLIPALLGTWDRS